MKVFQDDQRRFQLMMSEEEALSMIRQLSSSLSYVSRYPNAVSVFSEAAIGVAGIVPDKDYPTSLTVQVWRPL